MIGGDKNNNIRINIKVNEIFRNNSKFTKHFVQYFMYIQISYTVRIPFQGKT